MAREKLSRHEYFRLRSGLVVCAASFSFFNEVQNDLGHDRDEPEPTIGTVHTYLLSFSASLGGCQGRSRHQPTAYF